LIYLGRLGEGGFGVVDKVRSQVSYHEEPKLTEKVLCAKHLDTLISMKNLALVLDHQGKYEEAKQLYRQTFKLKQEVLGETPLS
jgi:Tetratricopeptide repeat